MKYLRTLTGGTLFFFLLVVNPAWFISCSEMGHEEEDFSFGEAEMLELLEEINGSTWSVDGYNLEFALDQRGEEVARQWLSKPGLIASAKACSNRTFVSSAAACMDITEMPLHGEVAIYQADDGELVEALSADGYMEVNGLNLSNAWIELNLQKEGEVTFSWHERDGEDFEMRAFSVYEIGDDGDNIEFTD